VRLSTPSVRPWEANRERDHLPSAGMKARDLDAFSPTPRRGQEYGMDWDRRPGQRRSLKLLRPTSPRPCTIVRRTQSSPPPPSTSFSSMPRERLLHPPLGCRGRPALPPPTPPPPPATPPPPRGADREIDIAPALDVPDLGVGGTLGVHRERVGADAEGHGLWRRHDSSAFDVQGGSPCKELRRRCGGGIQLQRPQRRQWRHEWQCRRGGATSAWRARLIPPGDLRAAEDEPIDARSIVHAQQR